MDRLRKRLEDIRVKVQKLVKYNWHNEPEGDKFRSLDAMFVLGAVRYNPTGRWQRISWNVYCVVPACSFSIFVLNAVDELSEKFDLLKATWHSTLILATALCIVKDLILNRHFESILEARSFVDSKPCGSGDDKNDSACRKKLFQRLQLTVLVLFTTLLIDEVIFNVPGTGIDKLFGTPRILNHLGPAVASGVHCLFLLTLLPIWFNKYCASTGTVCSLLLGFKTEYEIFVQGFENILDNVHADVEEEFPSTSKGALEWKRNKKDQLFWKYLEQRVNGQVKLHIQLVEKMQLLEPIVKELFAILYYNAMVLFSPLAYVVLTNGLSFATVYLVSGIALNLVDCYAWCTIIESHQDINESLEIEIMDLLTKIPHSQQHHNKYTEMRSTLCTMKTFVRNHEPFSCGGVFPITVEAFTELLNIGYTVVTFLIDIGKKA